MNHIVNVLAGVFDLYNSDGKHIATVTGPMAGQISLQTIETMEEIPWVQSGWAGRLTDRCLEGRAWTYGAGSD